MKTYTFSDTMVCYVTWTYSVKAESESEAFDKYADGEAEQIGGPEIGDGLDSFPSELNLINVGPGETEGEG